MNSLFDDEDDDDSDDDDDDGDDDGVKRFSAIFPVMRSVRRYSAVQ